MKYHPELTLEKWRQMPQDKQILSVAAEFGRAKSWILKNEEEPAKQALERAFELMDLTIELLAEKKASGFLKEFLRFREMLAGFYLSSKKDLREFMILFRTLLAFDPAVYNLGLKI